MLKLRKNVVDEVMDGELLAIDDMTGNYFSVSGGGLRIWRLLRAGSSPELIAETVGDVHGASAGAEAAEFVRQVLDAGLLEQAAIVDFEVPAPIEEWSKPVFEVYGDLQELLLFDPIHEAADVGWPHVPSPE